MQSITLHEGKLWYGDSDGNVLVLASADGSPEVHCTFESAVAGVAFITGNDGTVAKLFATKSGLFYERSDDFTPQTQYDEIGHGLECNDIKTHGHGKLHVAGSQSGRAFSLSGDINPRIVETDTILGLSSVFCPQHDDGFQFS